MKSAQAERWGGLGSAAAGARAGATGRDGPRVRQGWGAERSLHRAVTSLPDSEGLGAPCRLAREIGNVPWAVRRRLVQ